MRVRIGARRLTAGRVTIEFHRTLRVPDDEREYPLAEGLGAFPIFRVKDYISRVPAPWRQRGGVFIPMYQREALRIRFDAPEWRPNAVKVGAGGVNAVSGGQMDARLRQRPPDYITIPEQPWLDGVHAGHGFIRQFVATPLGGGGSVEAQLTGTEEGGGLELIVFESRAGRFPTRAPDGHNGVSGSAPETPGPRRSAPGERLRTVMPDPHGIDSWDPERFARIHVHIVNSEAFTDITGLAAPPTPVSAETYIDWGLPWSERWDSERDVAPRRATHEARAM